VTQYGRVGYRNDSLASCSSVAEKFTVASHSFPVTTSEHSYCRLC